MQNLTAYGFVKRRNVYLVFCALPSYYLQLTLSRFKISTFLTRQLSRFMYIIYKYFIILPSYIRINTTKCSNFIPFFYLNPHGAKKPSRSLQNSLNGSVPIFYFPFILSTASQSASTSLSLLKIPKLALTAPLSSVPIAL